MKTRAAFVLVFVLMCPAMFAQMPGDEQIQLERLVITKTLGGQVLTFGVATLGDMSYICGLEGFDRLLPKQKIEQMLIVRYRFKKTFPNREIKRWKFQRDMGCIEVMYK